MKSNIENVKVFTYLSCQIHFKEQNTGTVEVTARIDMAETAFYQHSKKLMNRNIKLVTRVNILNSLVRSRLTYGCQTWTLTTRKINQLDSTYMTMLRKMIRNGFARIDTQNKEWSYLYTNRSLLEICKTETIQSYVTRLKQRYLGHLIRLKDDSLIKRLAFNSNKMTRPGQQINYYKRR